jgi:hypothetical protein
MDKIKIFNIPCFDEIWLQNAIIQFNQSSSTDFRIEEMIDDEVLFAKVSTTNEIEQIFYFSAFIGELQMIEYIEGKI